VKRGEIDFKDKISYVLTDHIVWVLLILLFIIGTIIEPVFANPYNILNILSHSVPMALMVFGLSLLLMLGRIDLSVESTYAIAPIVANLMVLRWMPWLPGWLTIFLCLGIGALIGLFNGYLSVKLGISDFLVGLSMLLFLRGIVKFLISEGLYGLPEAFTFLGSERIFNGIVSISIFVIIVVFVLLRFFTGYRPFGRKILAIGSNRDAAYISGINTKKIELTAFALSGFFAAFGGMITAGRQLSCTNAMGENQVMTALAAVVLGGIIMTGGKGTVIGALGGAILLQSLDNLLTIAGVNPFMQDAIFGGILLAAIIFQGVRLSTDRK
jgi:ribose/xylose/arabinose/galactoside ABC-type transport system permease subunit